MTKYDYKKIADFYLSGMTVTQISKIEGCSLGTISIALKKQNIKIRPTLKGEKHHLYKNGKYKDHDDYIIINDGKVREHRHIFEKHINRTLEHWEHVHHINGLKSDNVITNLVLMPTREHTRFHNFLRNCSLDINKENLEKFCIKEGEYTYRFTKEQLIKLGMPNTFKIKEKKKCKILNCNNSVYAHKLCSKHYQRKKAIAIGGWKSGGNRFSKVYLEKIDE
jgi:hypothetical protein